MFCSVTFLYYSTSMFTYSDCKRSGFLSTGFIFSCSFLLLLNNINSQPDHLISAKICLKALTWSSSVIANMLCFIVNSNVKYSISPCVYIGSIRIYSSNVCMSYLHLCKVSKLAHENFKFIISKHFINPKNLQEISAWLFHQVFV